MLLLLQQYQILIKFSEGRNKVSVCSVKVCLQDILKFYLHGTQKSILNISNQKKEVFLTSTNVGEKLSQLKISYLISFMKN